MKARNNRLSEEDAEKVCISSFDESDPRQHTMKILFGCGSHFGFRGRLEHHALEREHIGKGTFEKDHLYGGMPYVSVQVMNDKTNRITLHNPYLRSTGKLMRIPVLDNDPTSSCFGGSLLRYLEKMNPDQRWLHCRAVDGKHRDTQLKKNLKGFYYSSCKLGHHAIATLFREGAEILGILSDDFCPHSLRALFITNMVNDGSVSNKESMMAARHTSVKAHLDYQETGKVSEGLRIKCLLDARPDKKKSPGPIIEPKTPRSIASIATPRTGHSKNSSVGKPGISTQLEWASFCEKKREFGKSLGLEVGAEEESECIDIEKAAKEIDEFGEYALKKKRKKSKLRKKIEDLNRRLEEKEEQFNSASKYFNRVIDFERLYRRELDSHYEDDVLELKRNLEILMGEREKDETTILHLQRENEILRVELERSKSFAFGRRHLFEEKENHVRMKPRKVVSTVRNPYIRKHVGPLRTPSKNPDTSLSTNVINPYLKRNYYR